MPLARNLRSAARKSPLYRPYVRLKYRFSRRARSELFSGYYRENVWGDAQSRSGSGSSVAATETIRRALPRIVLQYEVDTMLDIPCGDWEWMRLVAEEMSLVRYYGADIAPDLIERLKSEYGRADRTFIVADAVTGPLPRVDLILARDLLIHLPNPMARRALRTFERSGARWLLTTHYPAVQQNVNIDLGHYRPINLTLPPFELPEPVEIFDEMADPAAEIGSRSMGLWSLAN